MASVSPSPVSVEYASWSFGSFPKSRRPGVQLLPSAATAAFPPRELPGSYQPKPPTYSLASVYGPSVTSTLPLACARMCCDSESRNPRDQRF